MYLPMAVLEEMDAAGKGTSESARNIREVSRILDGIIRAGGEESIEQGLPLPATGERRRCRPTVFPDSHRVPSRRPTPCFGFTSRHPES